MNYKIVKKKDKNAVYASGFYSLRRANEWLDNYDPRMWTEKDVTKADLEIVEDK